jgi:hypothetical protein
MPTPQSVKSPEKELRFTRSAQGLQFIVLCVISVVTSLALWVLATQGTEFERPRLDGLAWTALLPLPLAFFTFRLAMRCIRHAYLILTPLGIEIFPLFRPDKNMALIIWQEIHTMELRDATTLVLHRDAEKTSGIVLSLKPILASRRQLLHHTIHGISRRQNTSPTS